MPETVVLSSIEQEFLFDVLEEVFPGISDSHSCEAFGTPGIYPVEVGTLKMTAIMVGREPDHELATDFTLEGDGWSLSYKINPEDAERPLTTARTVTDHDLYIKQVAILRLAGFEVWPTQ